MDLLEQVLPLSGAAHHLEAIPGAPMTKYPSVEAYLTAKSEMDAATGCISWKGCKSRDGYGRVDMRSLRRQSIKFAHRASYIERVGPIPEDREIDHLCRNRACINPEHLRLATREENMAGRIAPRYSGQKGDKHWRAKLGDNDIPKIRLLRSVGFTMTGLAAYFGVSIATISNICNRKGWKHVI